MNSVQTTLEALKAHARLFHPQAVFHTYKDAFAHYSALSAAGDAQAHYGCGCLYLEGRGVPKDTEEGFACMLKAACFHTTCHLSLRVLSECYEKGVGVDRNPVEAYIWALMFVANVPQDDPAAQADPRIAALEKLLSTNVYRKAAKEAGRREKLRVGGELTPEYCLAQAARYRPTLGKSEVRIFAGPGIQTEHGLRFPLADGPHYRPELAQIPAPALGPADVPRYSPGPADAYSRACLPSAVATPAAPEPPQPFAGWEVSDLAKLQLHINPRERSIVVRYGRRSARFGLRDLFSPCALRLLIDFDKHAADPHEPPVAYWGDSVSRALGQTRSNQRVVSDFNSRLRALFGLEKQVKAFAWLPGTLGRRREKSLRINFQLQVHYRS